jgi:hypothetical protein
MTALAALAERVSRGEALTDADADVIVSSHDLIAVGMMADEVRRRLHGPRATFCRVIEVHVDAVPATLPSTVSAGEVRIVGTPGSLAAAAAAVTAVKRLAGAIPVSGFVLSDLARLDEEHVYGRLRVAGLDRVAYAPIEWDAVASATKLARDAGLVVDRLALVDNPGTVSIAPITRARDLQHALGGFRTFAPLPRTTSESIPTTGYDDVRMVAAARLVAGAISTIQVDWEIYGPKLAQVALTMGADDIDSVAAVETGTLGTRRSAIEEIRNNIAAAGFEPVERDGAFEVRANRSA